MTAPDPEDPEDEDVVPEGHTGLRDCCDECWWRCRRKVLAARRQGWSVPNSSWQELKHGIASYNKGCPCALCRDAARRRSLRKRQRDKKNAEKAKKEAKKE